MTPSAKASLALVPILTLLLALAGCGGTPLPSDADRAASGGAQTEERTEGPAERGQEGAAATAGDPRERKVQDVEDRRGPKNAEGGGSDPRKGANTKRASSSDVSSVVDGALERGPGGRPQRVLISVRGDPGMRFSGTCAVGERTSRLEGRVPENLTYRLKGRLECTLRKQSEGAGVLRVVLTSAGDRHAQRTDSGQAVLRFVYSGGSLSSVTRALGPASQSVDSQSQDSSVRRYSRP